MKNDKKFTNPYLHYGFMSLIFFVGFVTLLGLTFDHVFLHHHQVYAEKNCSTIGKGYVITINKNQFTPDKLIISRCDRVTFLNNDPNTLYLPAFGDHPNHIEYAGFTEKILKYDETNSFVAHTTGIFSFHDHIKDLAEGKLTIK